MSGCTRCRWGTNTNPDRPVNTENAKRLESGLQNLLAERQCMDTIWSPPTQTQTQTQIEPIPSNPIPIPKKPVQVSAVPSPRPDFMEPSKPPQKKNYSGILYN